MAIALRSKGAWFAGTTSVSATMPTTHAAGDLLLMFIHTCNNAITTAPGNGWALLSPSPVSTGTADTALGVRLTVYWKIAASSSEAAQTVSVTGGTATNGITAAFSGVDVTTPFDLTPVSAVAATSTADISCPTLTTATNVAMIVNAVALDNDTNSTSLVSSAANSSLASITIGHQQTVNTGTGGGVAFLYGIKTAAGLISATTATVAAAARAYLTIALRPIKMATGTFSTSAAGTVTVAVIKKGQSAASVSQASTVTNVGRKGGQYAATISSTGTVTVAGLKQEGARTGSVAITQASTVTAVGRKTRSEILSISNGSSVNSGGQKRMSTTVSISASGTVTIAGKKIGKSTVSTSSAGTVTVVGSHAGRVTVSITSTGAVTLVGRKARSTDISITGTGTVTIVGKKGFTGAVSITQASSVTISGIKTGKHAFAASAAGTVIINYRTGRKGPVSIAGTVTMTVVAGIPRVMMILYSDGSLRVKVEFVEGATANLSSTGVMTAVELIEGTFAKLSSDLRLMATTFIEGGIS